MLHLRWIAAPLSALVWASYVLIVIVWTPLVLGFRAVTFPWDRNRRRVGRLFHASAVLAGTITPFWRFRIVGAEAVDPQTPYLFAANHRSFADIFLLVRLPWEMKWLSKDAIFRIPLLGWQMRIAGDVPIARGEKESARRALDTMRSRLRDGSSVIVFPEGTRGTGAALGPFREGAFRLAIETGVDVVPIAVLGTEAALPPHSVTFGRATATARVLPPISTRGLSASDAAALAEDVRARIAGALGIPAPTRSAVR